MNSYNYYQIAQNDYKYLQYNMCNDVPEFYNRNAILCEQVVEKLLKHLVQGFCFKEDYSPLLKGHNLVKLYSAIKDENLALELSVPMLRTLKDYYFDANYPGDNFILITKDELDEAYAFTREVMAKVSDLI